MGPFASVYSDPAKDRKVRRADLSRVGLLRRAHERRIPKVPRHRVVTAQRKSQVRAGFAVRSAPAGPRWAEAVAEVRFEPKAVITFACRPDRARRSW